MKTMKEIKKVNDLISAYTELVMNEVTPDMFVTWCNEHGISEEVREHCITLYYQLLK